MPGEIIETKLGGERTGALTAPVLAACLSYAKLLSSKLRLTISDERQHWPARHTDMTCAQVLAIARELG